MTAVSNVAIANRALSKIGDKCITAFDDSSKAARAMTACFDLVRDAELRRHTWAFSKARAELAALADAPLFGYAYQYQLPSDFLKLISAGDVAPGVDTSGGLRTTLDQADYQIEGRSILTDLGAPLKLRYVRRVTDPAQFDATFVEALAARLAYEVALELTDAVSRKQDAAQDYRQALVEAVSAGAVEMPPQPLADDSWLLARQ